MTETADSVWGIQVIFADVFGGADGVDGVWVVKCEHSYDICARRISPADLIEDQCFELFKTAADRCVEEGHLDPTKHGMMWCGVVDILPKKAVCVYRRRI